MNRAERRAWRIWNLAMDCFQVRYNPAGLPRRNLWRLPELPRIWFWCVPNENNAYYRSLSRANFMWIHRPYTISSLLGPLVSYTKWRRWRDHSSHTAWRVSCRQIDIVIARRRFLASSQLDFHPYFQYAISHCNSVYGETLLSNFTWQ
jgi:hypothetical protein